VDYYLKGTTWEDAACWMDKVKSDKKYDYMKSWHFMPFARDASSVKPKDVNLQRQLETSLNILKRRDILSLDMIGENIRIIFHLVGDLHDPLNCGYPEDNYGSNAMVKLRDRPYNLRTVWDDVVINENKIDVWSCAKYIFKLKDKERQEIQKIDVSKWITDSRALLNGVYNFTDGALPADYLSVNGPVVEKQLAAAGLRLAAILNSLLK
jgi:hypothetical protein